MAEETCTAALPHFGDVKFEWPHYKLNNEYFEAVLGLRI
jgi:hypothetical protein